MPDGVPRGWLGRGMVSSISVAVERCATWRIAVAASVGVVGCVGGLAWRQARLAGLDLLDSRGWYTPDEAAALLDALDRLDANARAVYATTALTIDMVFPASYGLLLAVLLLRLFRGGALLCLLPLTVALADGLENITVAVLALVHDGAPSLLAWPAAVFTAVKTALFVATVAVICAGAMRWMWERTRHSR
ncbi:MAG: hypothetical protein OXM57_00140 [bacterium]|nr:hypothetical protein [bacterium]MDE0351091.1 hypothetical protein [bacterium]